ncbi:MFS transporter [Ottowia sp.]|uniref:MFS transporter n=1 Tax=Ottowia sp. TaxID=1898956 RepID=UPI002CDE7D96|nr:MFS transporter [Ottowia sp.]HRN76125.1 MFS transporter [Ottowia sp.]HRQ03461.1 MFS transporter [Ottowia sp.]
MPPEPAAAPALSPRSVVLGLSALQLVSWGSVFYGFALFMEPVEQSLALSRAQSSLAFSLALLAEGLAAFAIGRWIDRGRERAVMTGGSLVLAAGLLAQGLASSLVGFYAAWITLGLGLAATLYTPVFAVVTRRYPSNFRRAIITITFLGGLASTVFIPLTDLLVRAIGWRGASWSLAALHLLLCAPLHAWLLRGAPSARACPHDGSARAAGGEALTAHLRSPPFWYLGVFIVLLLAATAALPPHLVSLLRESGLPPAWAIAVPASIGALQVLGRLVLYVGERQLDVHATNRWAPLLVPLGLLTLLLGYGHPSGTLLFVALFGIGNGMLTIVKGTVMAQYVSAAHVGALNGALGLPLALARAAAPLAVGLLWTPRHGYALGLVLLLALSVLGLATLWRGQALALRAPR